MSVPQSRTQPASGGSSPTRVRSSVLLPLPLAPRMTSVSPARTSRSTPCRMGLPSNAFSKPRTSITTLCLATSGEGGASDWSRGCISATPVRSAPHVEESGGEQVGGDDEDDGPNHRGGGRAPDLLGAATRLQPLVTTDQA